MLRTLPAPPCTRAVPSARIRAPVSRLRRREEYSRSASVACALPCSAPVARLPTPPCTREVPSARIRVPGSKPRGGDPLTVREPGRVIPGPSGRLLFVGKRFPSNPLAQHRFGLSDSSCYREKYSRYSTEAKRERPDIPAYGRSLGWARLPLFPRGTRDGLSFVRGIRPRGRTSRRTGLRR